MVILSFWGTEEQADMVLPFIAVGVAALVAGITGTWAVTKAYAPKETGKTMETSGEINNIVVADVQGKAQGGDDGRIFVVICIICTIKALEFCYFVYRKHIGGILKRKERERAIAI